MVLYGMPNKHQTITIQKIGHILVLDTEYKQTDSSRLRRQKAETYIVHLRSESSILEMTTKLCAITRV